MGGAALLPSGMNRVLPCLLAACLLGSASSGPAGGNPFKVGQLWVMISTSRLDDVIPGLISFRTVRAAQQGRQVVGDDAIGLGGQDVLIDYDAANHVVVITDRIAKVYGSKNLRVCVFDVRVSGPVYRGWAAHFAASRPVPAFNPFFRAWAAKHPTSGVQGGIAAYTKSLAPSDTAPCKLDLG